MSVLDWCLVAAGLLAVGWSVFAPRRATAVLAVVSVGALALAAATLLIEGVQWQLVPWQALGLIVAALAALRRRRRGKDLRESPAGADRGRQGGRWAWLSERMLLLALVAVGAWALLWAFVPTLPTPSGPYRVGTEVFHWTDTSRHQPWGPNTSEYRQVVAQAWYPTAATQGRMAPYFEDPGELPGMGGLPAFVFSGSFRNAATHGILAAPISKARSAWPVLLFSPGLELPREIYTGLCTALASRGYVVVALSSPYESAVTELANGKVVASAFPSNPSETQLYELVKTRSADASFALDQLEHLASTDPHSALLGHLDLTKVGIFGHSLGGASAIQATEEDPRFRVAINLDGTLWGSQPSEHLDRPFLWIESAERSSKEEKHDREQFLSGLKAGGALVKITHSLHLSFTDEPSYMTSLGRTLLGERERMGRRSLTTMATLTAELIAAFVGPELGVEHGTTLDQVAAANRAVELEREIAPAG
jgi:predicted dienelactone hydrolase